MDTYPDSQNQKDIINEQKTQVFSSDLDFSEDVDFDLDKNDEQNLSDKAKSSLRIKYETEVDLVIKQLGDLENIRLRLALSRRKICQLLLVDPSAWTRWTKGISPAPPHIYRALQWYIALQDKYPGLNPNIWLGSFMKNNLSHEDKEKLKNEVKESFRSEIFHQVSEQEESLKEIGAQVVDVKYLYIKQERAFKDLQSEHKKWKILSISLLCICFVLLFILGSKFF